MSRHLNDLQAELQLIIITHLLPTTTGLLDTDIQEKYDANGMYVRTRDLKRKEREAASRRDLMNWSCTSWFYRNLLAPYIFHSVTIRNDEKSAASVNAIVQYGGYGMCVRELRFVGTAPGIARRDDAAFSDIVNILPESVANLLSNLARFPNLEWLSVEFAYDFGNWHEWRDEGVNMVGEVESEEEAKAAERREAWRAVMAKTWEAILKNEPGVVKKLAINNLYYKKVSVFDSPIFHRFLNSLEDFSLSIWAGDNGAGWKTNTCETWAAFVIKLDSYFFAHLHNITSLTLRTTEEAPLGLRGLRHAALVLRKEHMPLLRTAHLEYIFIGPELRDFLVGHLSTLESIHLRSCLAELNTDMAENSIPWHDMFSAIVYAHPTKLRDFKISEDRPPELPCGVSDCNRKPYSRLLYGDDAKLKSEIKEANEIVTRGERRFFGHTIVDSKLGDLLEDREENLFSYREGKDQSAFEKLMNIVRRNADDNGLYIERQEGEPLGPRAEGSQAA